VETQYYLFSEQVLNSEEIKKRTGLNATNMDSEILEEFGVQRLISTVQGTPNEPWTYLADPVIDGSSIVFEHKQVDLETAKGLAKALLIQQANDCCKGECAQANIDAALLPSLSPTGALGDLRTHLDEVAAKLEGDLEALTLAESTDEVLALVLPI
jgi:hypothetical protein